MKLSDPDKKILHIKIPKNGTHSINEVLLNRDTWNRVCMMGHDRLLDLENNNDINESFFIFCVSRNPFTRFYGQYKHLQRLIPRFSKKSLLDFKRSIEKDNLSDFIEDKELRFLISAKQKEWVISNKNIKLNKIYKLENIEDFEQDFKLKLQYKNKGNYLIQDYKDSFNEEIKKFIVDFYKDDFFLFNYEFNFEKSIYPLRKSRKIQYQ